MEEPITEKKEKHNPSFAKDSELLNLVQNPYARDCIVKNPTNWLGVFHTRKFFWVKYLYYPVIALLGALIVSSEGGADPDNGQACDGVDNIERNSLLCHAILYSEAGVSIMKFLTPIIVGGFVVSVVSMWRLRRTNYCTLCGAVRNLNVNLASLLPIPDQLEDSGEAKRIMHVRKTLARWSLLGFELSVLKAREQVDNPKAAIPHLMTLELLEEGEWDVMVPGD